MTTVIHGFVLIDAWASALNNAGAQRSERTDNIVRTKVFWRGKQAYPYVSGQAWRFWWRSTLEEKSGWDLSPINREKKIAYTEADPLTYPDDDIFGYMRAPKKVKDAAGKKMKSETLTRLSALKNSALVSVSPHRPTEDFGTFSRFEGDPVPYEHEFYSTVMKGIFSLDMESVGVFKTQATAGSQHLPSNFAIPEEHSSNCEKDEDYIVLKKDLRVKRARETLQAIYHLSGGAMQARHLTRVAPSLVVVGGFSTGTHMFNHLVGEKDGEPEFKFSSIEQILSDYEEDRLTPIYIGREEGFMDSLSDDLKKLHEAYKDRIVIGSVRQVIDALSDNLDALV